MLQKKNLTILSLTIANAILIFIMVFSYISFNESSHSTLNSNEHAKTQNNSENEDSSVSDSLTLESFIVSSNSNSTSTATESVDSDYSEYIFEDSDSRALTKEEVEKLTDDELRYARNEIFARHGYVFKDEELINYFSALSWYEPDSNFDAATEVYNEYEKENSKLIKSVEDERKK